MHEFFGGIAVEEGRPTCRQVGLSSDSVEGTQGSQWSRKHNREMLDVLHTRQTKHEHEM